MAYCSVAIALLVAFQVEAKHICPILPTPSSYVQLEGKLSISGKISINEDEIPDPIREFLLRKCVNDLKLITVFTPVSEQFVFKRLYNVPKDSYSIRIDNGITINYSSEESCFYALTSLFQLMERRGDEWLFQKCFVGDAPKFDWRGLHLDVCKNFFGVDEVKRYIDLMSQYKLNIFHFKLSDEDEWRLEIKKYPELTLGSVSNDEIKPDGKFYTREEIKEIVSYAAERYITVVPEIDLNVHKDTLLAVSKDLLCLGTLDFEKGILEEVAELFPSPYVYLGNNNANNDGLNLTECQAVMKENGLITQEELQSWFLSKLDTYLVTKSKKLILGNDSYDDKLSKNVMFLSRGGFEEGLKSAKEGHYTIMAPNSHCSFDYDQSKDPNESSAHQGFTPVEKVYAFHPIPEGISPDIAAYVVGGQANLCTALIPDMKTLEYMSLPRAIALAQALWCENKPDFEMFRDVLINYHFKRLDEQRVNYSKAIYYPDIELFDKRGKVGIVIKSSIKNNPLDVTVNCPDILLDKKNILPTDTLFIERTKGRLEKPYSVAVKPQIVDKIFTYAMTAHPALAMPIKLITPSVERNLVDASFKLTNGIRGNRPWRENEWIGFESQVIEMQIDFEQKTNVYGIQMGFLSDSVSPKRFPKEVTVFYSTKRGKWKSAGSFSFNSLNDAMFFANFVVGTRSLKLVINIVESTQGKKESGMITRNYIDELILYFEP
jgi:hexosaminidase